MTNLLKTLLPVTMLMLGACATPPIYKTLTCSETRTHKINIAFQSNGCLVTQNGVQPEMIETCPGDTVIWQAQRDGTDSTNTFTVFFNPMNRSVRPIFSNRIEDTIWTDAPQGYYKYSIVGRTLRPCPNNSVDPRIKVDPR